MLLGLAKSIVPPYTTLSDGVHQPQIEVDLIHSTSMTYSAPNSTQHIVYSMLFFFTIVTKLLDDY